MVTEQVDPDTMELRRQAAQKRARLREAVFQKCREDFPTFAEYVGRSESDGEPIELTASQCEWAEAFEREKRVVLWGYPESGRSTILGVLYVLWRLGKDPGLRVAIVGFTAEQPSKDLAAIKSYIEKSAELHDVFPALAPGSRWTTTKITIKRDRFSRDPSVQVMGAKGTITGSRVDLLIFDDFLDYENVRNEEQRDVAMQRCRKRFLSRLTKNAMVAFFANAWHQDDVAHRLERDGWWAKRYPVLDENGQSTDPKRWPLARIEEVRTKILVDEAEFNRSMMCIPRDDTTARFKEEWIRAAYGRGEDIMAVVALDEIPPGCAIIHGVDLAVSQKSSAARSVIVSILIYPNGDRQILAVRLGRWTGPEIVSRILDVDRRYGGIFIVENVATQQYILQFADQEAPMSLVPFTTGRNKLDPRFGVESLAVELERGRWILPSWRLGLGGEPVQERDPGVVKLAGDLLDYKPNEHTADTIMAMWIGREGARRFAPAHMADREQRRPALGAHTFRKALPASSSRTRSIERLGFDGEVIDAVGG